MYDNKRNILLNIQTYFVIQVNNIIIPIIVHDMNTDVDMGFIPIVHSPQRKIPAIQKISVPDIKGTVA
jgi:hypothetical protein